MGSKANRGKIRAVQKSVSLKQNIETQARSLRSLDPRTKIFILILINVVAISLSNIKMEIICMALIGCTLLWQGMYKTCLKYWLIYAVMLGLFALSSQYQNAATAMLAVLCIIMRKTLPIFMFASSVISKTRVSELIAALQAIHVPKSIIIALSVTIRFFPTLREEYSLISDAMKMRGIRFSVGNIFLHPMMLIESILVPIMLRMSTITEELSAAAVIRGIDSSRYRTSYYEIRFGVMDGVFILLFLALSIVSAVIGG